MTTLNFDVFWRDHGAAAGMKSLGKEADQGAKRMQGYGDKMKKVGAVAGVAAAAFGTLLVKGAAKAVTAASDMNETLNKSSVIFGKNQKEIAAWAKGAAKNLGLSQQQAMESAASFGDMFLQLGFAGKSATAMSKSVVQLAADLGSFNNLPTADVQERIAAAFRGEYDSLQALVPTINAAKVEQVALATTGKKSADSLTQQEKAAAVLKITMDSTKRAQGDFAKTSDGLANSVKIARARLDDMAASAGKALLPFAGGAMKGFNHFLDRLQNSASLKDSLKGLSGSLRTFVTNGDDATATADGLADSFIDLAANADKGAKSFNKTNSRFSLFVEGQRAMVLKWRQVMLKGALDVYEALGRFDPRMKKHAANIRRMMEETRQEAAKTADVINRKKIVAKLRADKSDAQAKVKDINRQLETTRDKRVITRLRGDKANAQAAIRSINAQLNQLDGKEANVWIRTHRVTYYGTKGKPPTNPKGDAFGGPIRRAEGGSIPGSSPSNTADNIPIMATAGEYMQPVSAVRKYGEGAMNAIRTGRVPASALRGYASGGSVGGGWSGGSSGGDTYILQAPNYLGTPNDLRRTLVNMVRSGELPVVRR